MRFLIVSLLVLGASAFPTVNFTLTVDMLNKMIEQIKTESQYVPSYVMDQINSATEAEKQQFVDLMNRIYKGEFPPVSSTQQFVETVEKEAPLIGPKARAIYNSYMERYNNLTPEAKQFVTTWENKWFEAMQTFRADRQAFFKDMIGMTKDLLTDIKNLKPETWASLKEQFPEQVKAWEECPQFKALRAFMDNLPRNSDLTKDPETLNKIMELGFKKYIPAEAIQA